MTFGSIGEKCRISDYARFYGAENIFIGNNVRIDDFVIITAKEPVYIGDYVHIAAYSAIHGTFGVTIKDFVNISSNISIYSASDDYSGRSLTSPVIPDKYKSVVTGRVILERHVIVGANSVILPNVTIGEGTAVGAMSFVKKDLPSFKICYGIPCKVMKDRDKKFLELEKEFLNSL